MSHIDYAIGIDLGTANTCTVIFQHNRAEVVTHDGSTLMPSYVAFTESGRLVGRAAKDQASHNPHNTIHGALRFLGRSHGDPSVHTMVQDLPFHVEELDGRLVFALQHRGTDLYVTPVEIVAMIFAQARKDIQLHLGRSDPIRAVITVPAYFNFAQRQAVRDAALVADITPVRISSAAVNACVDYAVTHLFLPNNRNILVADIGAGSVDVALAALHQGRISVKAVASENVLGGDDIDSALIRRVARQLDKPRYNSLSENGRAFRRLRTACRKAKQTLSKEVQCSVTVSQLFTGHDFQYLLTRDELEECCADIFEKALQPLHRVLSDARLQWSDIHEVMLVGGSSRIVKLQESIHARSGKLSLSQHPEAAARGAAVHAAMLCKTASFPSIRGMELQDVAPFAIGIHSGARLVFPIIARNAQIPATTPCRLSGLVDNEDTVFIAAFEGDPSKFERILHLGQSTFLVPPENRESSHIDMLLDYDGAGQIILSVQHEILGQNKRLYLEGPDRTSPEQLDLMRIEFSRREVAMQSEHQRIETRNAVTKCLVVWLRKVASRYGSADADRGRSMGRKMQLWVSLNKEASTTELQLCLIFLKKVVGSIVLRDTEDHAEGLPTYIWLQEDLAPLLQLVKKANVPDRAILKELLEPIQLQPRIHAKAKITSDPTSLDLAASQIARNVKAIQADPHGSDADDFHDSEQGRREPSMENTPSFDHGPSLVDPQTVFRRDTLASPVPGNVANDDYVHVHMKQNSKTTNTTSQNLIKISPSSPGPIISQPFDPMDSPRSETPHSTESGIHNLFSRPKTQELLYTDTELSTLSTYLKNNGRGSWSAVPRLYTVLRLIDQLDMLDHFIELGITDIWLPFAQSSLPSVLTPTAQGQFIKHQTAVLSKSLLFEKDSNRKHAHFGPDEPVPFQIVGKLGAGLHGQVDKVISVVSSRDYARKRFRRRGGMSKDAIKSFLIELQVLKKVQHHHCVELVRRSFQPNDCTFRLTNH